MTGRTAIITGGGGAIGRAIGVALIAAGWRVILWDRDDTVNATAADIKAQGLRIDITDPAQCAEALSHAGPIGALIHCAGVGQIVPFSNLDRALWDKVMAINLTAPLFLTQSALPYLSNKSSVVVISSVSGIRAGFGRVAYGTSKAALIHLARQLSVELAPAGVTCNAVAPGPVDSPLAAGSHPSEQVDDYLAAIPQGHYGTPDDVAGAVSFLVGPSARHITGHCLTVDGGYLAAGVGVQQARRHMRTSR